MITIKDVAKAAGVSSATVSRVLNNKANVKPETVNLVYQTAKKLGYEPNMTARNLRRQETMTIMILVPNITNPYYAHIISGITDTTRNLGYSSFICNTGGSRDLEIEFLDMLAKRRADGAILLATELESAWLHQYAKDYPIVQCSEFDPQSPIPHVSIDNYQAARDAVAYLLELGHRRIGTISSENKYLSTRMRLLGYRDELSSAGISPSEAYVYRAAVDYSFQSGKNAAQALLSQENRPTALFCISDVLALGAIAGAREMGFETPDDITVIGFDDVEQTTIYRPNITTIAQPCYEIGKQGAELLYQHICSQGKADDALLRTEVVLPHKLIVRESCSRRDPLWDFRFAGTSGDR